MCLLRVMTSDLRRGAKVTKMTGESVDQAYISDPNSAFWKHMNVHFWGYTLWPALWPTFLNYISEAKCLDNLLTYISVPNSSFRSICVLFSETMTLGLRFDISISKYRTDLWSSLRDSFHIAHTYRPSMYMCILDVMIFVLRSDLHVLWIKHTFYLLST